MTALLAARQLSAPRVKWAVVWQMTAANDTSETSASYSFHELISGCRDCYRLMQVTGLIAVVTRLLSCHLINGHSHEIAHRRAEVLLGTVNFRTTASIFSRCKEVFYPSQLCRNYEELPEPHEDFIHVTIIRLGLRKLTQNQRTRPALTFI